MILKSQNMSGTNFFAKFWPKLYARACGCQAFAKSWAKIFICFWRNALNYFVFLFANHSFQNHFPHGPYLLFLHFNNLAGMPLTNFSKYEWSSLGGGRARVLASAQEERGDQGVPRGPRNLLRRRQAQTP